MKKDAYWFSHDSNSQDDPKCMQLIDQLGMEGYGIFWGLIEKLRCEKEYRLPISVCSSFAKRWGTSKEKVEAVILKYDLFKLEDEQFFFSKRLSESMNYKSLTGKSNALKRWGSNATALQLHSNGNPTAMQNDAITVKDIRVKESKEDNNTFNVFWQAYPKKEAKSKALIAWNKAKITEVLMPVILHAIDARKKTDQWIKEKGQFIPLPATYINQRRWEDEVELPKSYIRPDYVKPEIEDKWQ